MNTSFELSHGFDEPNLATWVDLAEKALKGAAFERLVETNFDGIELQPLYTALDVAMVPSLPLAARDPFLLWDVRQAFGGTNPATINAAILADLRGGVSSVELLVGGMARRGIAPADLQDALAGVLVDLAPIALSAGSQGMAAAQALDQHLLNQSANPNAVRPDFNFDLVTPWMAQGHLPDAFETMMAEAAALGAGLCARWPLATTHRASGRGAHEAGASAAQELAVMLASGVAHLRALEVAGIDPVRGSDLIILHLAVGQNVIMEIAKLRAARYLWARVLQECGAQVKPVRLQAVTSARMMTKNDAWSNILRVTCATFAAATGGADIITALPLTTALGGASTLARRLARNTQIVLMEETHLGHVADPGHGSYAIEALTRDIAEKAWALFQEIERQGGIANCLMSGWLQREIQRSAATQAKDVARRKSPIIGVSNHPLPGEKLPEFEVDNIAPVTPAGTAIITSLPWARVAQPFEAIRTRGEAAGSPAIFFANLGAVSDFAVRAAFARNLLAVGGLSTPGTEHVWPDVEALIAGFMVSGAKAAMICSSDRIYAEQAARVATALKAAGCTLVMLAGKPVEEAQLQQAGVDQFIYAGQDILVALQQIQAALEIAL